MENSVETREYIAGLVKRARAAMERIKDLTQEEVLRIARSIGWMAINKAEEWAEFNYNETRMGRIESKIARTKARARGLARDLSRAQTVGVIEVDEEKQLVKIAKPVGVLASLVPKTVPMGVSFIGSMNAIMGRNATIFSPHPGAKKSTLRAVEDSYSCIPYACSQKRKFHMEQKINNYNF